MISREEFISKCDKFIEQSDKDLYKKKQKSQIITILVVSISLLLVSIAFYFLWSAYIFLINGAVYAIFLIIVLSVSWFDWWAFKTKYSSKALDIMFEGYKYKYCPNAMLNEWVFRRSIFYRHSYDDYRGEDYISVNIPNDDGTPSSVVLCLSDLNVTDTYEYKDKDGNTQTRTISVYKGALGYISFPLKFKCNLSLNICMNAKDIKRIKTEDIKFNKSFKTYTDNQIEALVILNASMMNKLKNFERRFGRLKLTLSKDGKLYFSMNRDLFELNKQKPCGEVFSGYYDDICVILSIVDEIKTNNKVFDID